MPHTKNHISDVVDVVEEVKKSVTINIDWNRLSSKIITGLLTLIGLGIWSIAGMFWTTYKEIPKLKVTIENATSNYSTLQGAVNTIRVEMGEQHDQQIRMEEQLRNIERKLDTKN